MDERKKTILQRIIGLVSNELEIKVFSWTIMNDHYHLLCDFGEAGANMIDSGGTGGELTFATPKDKQKDKRSMLLTRFIRRIYSCSSKEFNKTDNTPARRIWYQYWDYCIRNKPDFWKHFNYIIQNPLKHKLVKSLEQAYYYPYSSNLIWLQRFGAEGLSESFVKFPVRNWTPIGEDV